MARHSFSFLGGDDIHLGRQAVGELVLLGGVLRVHDLATLSGLSSVLNARHLGGRDSVQEQLAAEGAADDAEECASDDG